MLTLKIFEPARCDTPDCLARASWSIVDETGSSVSVHCRKHAPGALLDAVRAEKAQQKPRAVKS